MAEIRHLENCEIASEKLSDFDEIWDTNNADLELGDSHVTKYKYL